MVWFQRSQPECKRQPLDGREGDERLGAHQPTLGNQCAGRLFPESHAHRVGPGQSLAERTDGFITDKHSPLRSWGRIVVLVQWSRSPARVRDGGLDAVAHPEHVVEGRQSLMGCHGQRHAQEYKRVDPRLRQRGHKTPARSCPSSVAMFDALVIYPLLLSVFIFIFVRRQKRSTLPYPPGPKGYPILGNVLDLTMSVPIWENLHSLANDHGTPKCRFVSRRF